MDSKDKKILKYYLKWYFFILNEDFSIIFILVLKEFKELLRKQATVEAFTEWLDALVEQKVVKVFYLRYKKFSKMNNLIYI